MLKLTIPRQKPGFLIQYLRQFLVGRVERSGTRPGKLGCAVAEPDLRMVFFRFGEGIVNQYVRPKTCRLGSCETQPKSDILIKLLAP